jgi:hypothetical protein
MSKAYVKITTPKGVAKYPWLNKPSTAFNKNEYKTGLLLDPNEEEVQKFLSSLDELAEQSAQAQRDKFVKEGKPALAKGVKIKSPYKNEIDKETGEETGLIELSFSTQAVDKKGNSKKVGLFDSKAKAINPEEVQVGGGSLIKVNFTPSMYYMPTNKEAGVKLYLNAVQVIELRSFGGGGDASSYGFGEEEGGFEATTDTSSNVFSGEGAEELDGETSTAAAEEQDEF